MKSFRFICATLAGFTVGSLFGQPTRTVAERNTIIEFTRTVTSRAPKADYASQLAQLPSPFQFPRIVPNQDRDTGPKFSDSQILRRVGITLRPQIRGIISRGDTFFIQTASGGLLREGQRFGVTVRQLAEGQIEIEIGTITIDGFILKYKDSEAYFPFYEQ